MQHPTFSPLASSSAISLLKSCDTGPPIPSPVNISGPVDIIFLPPTTPLSRTFAIPTPCSLPGQSCSVISGTSAATGLKTLCPNASAKTYPSPVEPVNDQLIPPVAMITQLELILSLPAIVTNPSVCFSIVSTRLPYMKRIFKRLAISSRTRLTSAALLVTGNTQPSFPDSVARDFSAKKLRTSSAVNSYRLCFKKRPH